MSAPPKRPRRVLLWVGALALALGLCWGMVSGRDDPEGIMAQPPQTLATQAEDYGVSIAKPPRALPLSSLSLPVAVPLSGIREAVNGRIPTEFARVDHQQNVLGGVSVQVRGTVMRVGDIRIVPVGDDTLRLEVPLKANFAVRPEVSRSTWFTGLENRLSRDFGGEAVVRLSIKPTLRPDWNLDAGVRGELTWTDPLAVELLPGTRFSVAKLADGAVREQMQRVVSEVARTIRESAAVRGKVEALWEQMQRPWPLPLGKNAQELGVQAAYLQMMPQRLTVAEFGLRSDALRLTLEAEGYLRAELGQPPREPAARAPLPALHFAERAERAGAGAVHLRVPIFLPFEELSATLSTALGHELAAASLPGGPFAPKLQLQEVRVAAAEGGSPHTPRLQLTVRLGVMALGRESQVVSVVSGRPWLRPDGRGISLENVRVETQRDGAAGWLVSLLADSRLERTLAQSARFDLGPRLLGLEHALAEHLPYSPARGVWLGGELGQLRLDDLHISERGLEVTAAADGALDVRINAGDLLRQPAVSHHSNVARLKKG